MAVLIAAYLTVSTEVLNQVGALNRTGVLVAWAVGLAGAVLWWRRRGGFTWTGWHGLLAGWGRADRLMVSTVAVLLLGELVLALVSAPNTYDSMTYHLPRVEQWVQRGSLDAFPTQIHRQVSYPPGAEYLLLHLRLATGGDWLYNLIQYAAGLVALLALTRVAAQLGGGRRAQLVTAFLVATVPLVVLEASSTQNDLVLAAWVAAVATFALDFRRTAVDTGIIGTTAGLILLTKPTGLYAAGPLLLWWAISGRDPGRWWGVLGRAVAVGGLVALIAAPNLARQQETFGRPTGPPVASGSLMLERHDPAALLVNALRIGQTAFDTPIPAVRRAQVAVVEWVADVVGVDVNDPGITFPTTTYPSPVWYPHEDKAAFPVQGALVLAAVLVALFAPRRLGGPPGRVRGLAIVITVAGLIYVSTMRWQEFGNRLVLFTLLLGAPLAGLLVARAFARWPVLGGWRQLVWRLTAATLVLAALAGVLSVTVGWPRRLVGPQSPFVLSRWDERFVGHEELAAGFRYAADGVRPTDPQVVGLIETNNSVEYPWYLLLPGRELVALRTPRVPVPLTDLDRLDAVVCQASRNACLAYLPKGWTLHWQDGFGYAVRPD